jgi:hypothetical protein
MVETFEAVEAAEYANASEVSEAKLFWWESPLTSSLMRDDQVRVVANGFERGESNPSRNMRCLNIHYIGKQPACKKTMK